MAKYQVKGNRTSLHIAGISERSKGSQLNYAVSACGALSRSYRFETLMDTDDLAAAVKRATVLSRKFCQNCAKAAELELA